MSDGNAATYVCDTHTLQDNKRSLSARKIFTDNKLGNVELVIPAVKAAGLTASTSNDVKPCTSYRTVELDEATASPIAPRSQIGEQLSCTNLRPTSNQTINLAYSEW